MLRFDGIQFLKDFKIRYTDHSPNVSQGWIGTPCPFCNDRSDHLGLHIATGAMSCWKCGKHSALEYILNVLRISKSEAKSIYSRYLTKNVHNNMYDINKQNKKYVTSISLPDNDFTIAERKYLKKRMLTSNHVEQYDLRGGGLTGDWAYRIVIPIYYNKLLVSATGRSIVSSVEPKYFTLAKDKSIMNLKHIFLGLDLVDTESIAVVEGPLDAIRGGPGFVASFGVNLSDEQLLLLLQYDTIYFVRDSDEAGDHFTKEAYKLASLGAKNVEVVTLEGFKDIGEASQEYIDELRKELCFVA